MHTVCFSSGNIYDLIESDISAGKTILSQLKVEGIEWHYGLSMASRPIVDSDLIYLKRMKHNSIHSIRSVPKSDIEALALFEKIQEDYNRVNARHIVFHPECLPSRKVLNSLDMNFLIENMNGLPLFRSKLGFEEVLKNNPDFDLCLDVAHSFFWSPRETKRIIQKWRGRIKEVHFSFARKGKDHLTSIDSTKTFIDSIKPLADLNVPVVIEEFMPKYSKESINEEVLRVREILSDLF